jgi:hypothetical protein
MLTRRNPFSLYSAVPSLPSFGFHLRQFEQHVKTHSLQNKFTSLKLQLSNVLSADGLHLVLRYSVLMISLHACGRD